MRHAMSKTLNVGAVSIGPADGGRTRLLAEAEAAIADLAARGADLVVLPELFAAPYYAGEPPAEWRGDAETIEGPTVDWARRVARREGLALLFGLALDDGGERPLNAVVLVGADGQAEVAAAKIHLPPPGRGDAFGEADHFDPGPPVIAAVTIAGLRVVALVCYDRRFPECWRAAAEAGADLVAVLVAGPAPDDPPGLYEAELRTHARANAVHAVAAARHGVETVLGHPVRHDGETMAIGPDGTVLETAAPGGTLLVAVDPTLSAAARTLGATAARLRLTPFEPLFAARNPS